MARYDFGGTLADFVVTSRRLGGLDVLGLSAATLTFWSAQTGGTRYTDLTLNGSAASSITVGTDGQVPKFQGPDGVTEMWVDGGSARIRVVTLQGAPGPAGKDGLPGVNAVANDTATAGYVNAATSATGKALTTATARSLGWSIITDQQWAGGADPTGAADSTAAIDAAMAGAGPRRVYAPPGTYIYNGSGVEIDHLTLDGAGRNSTKFSLGAGKSLLIATTGCSDFKVSNCTFDGGFGAISIRATGDQVANHRIIENNSFLNYTGVAILSLLNDNPYWTIKHNRFSAAGDQAGQIGVALLRNADVSVIQNNAFLKNQVHVKLGNNGQTLKIVENDFIRFNSPTSSPNARADIWVLPSGTGTGAYHVRNNKFGNENLNGPVDFRVLIADENTASGDFSTRMWSTAQSSGTTGQATLDGNMVSGAASFGQPRGFVTSYTPNVSGYAIVNSQIIGAAPTAMLEVVFPAAKPQRSNVVGPTQWVNPFANPLAYTSISPCPPGYAAVVDPTGVHRDAASLAPFPGAGASAGASLLFRTAVSSWLTVGSPSRTTITDSVGESDAMTVTVGTTGDRYYATTSGYSAGVPMWFEADLRLTAGASPQITAAQMSLDNNGVVVVGRSVDLSSTWRTVRLPFVLGSSLPNQVAIRPSSTSSATGQFDVGRVRVYQAAEPVNIDGAFVDMVRAPGGVVTKVAGHAGTALDSDVSTARNGAIVGTSDGFYGRLNGVWTQLGSTSAVPANPFGGFALSTGDESFDRNLVTANGLTLSSGVVRLSYMVARKSETTTQVRVFSGGTAAAATPTVCQIGLYLVDGSGNLTLVASTVSDTTLFSTANISYTRSWQASYAKVAGQRYALGWLVTSAATMPTVPGANLFNGASSMASEAALDPRLSGTNGTGLSALPASMTAGSIASTVSRAYGVVLP